MISLAYPRSWVYAGDGTVTIDDDDPAGDYRPSRRCTTTSTRPAARRSLRSSGWRRRRRGSVDYQTSDGSATAGADYAARSGTFNWAAGDGADKTVTVPVTWDGRAEGTESINLALTNPAGAPTWARTARRVVRIGDDGAAARPR